MNTAPAWTVADAVAWLHPAISRRTLNRLIAEDHLQPVGYRRHCGRPAAEYPPARLQQLHAAWKTRQDGRDLRSA